MGLDAATCALGQGIRESAADVARPVDVGFEIDRCAGASNRRQHGPKAIFVVLGAGAKHGITFTLMPHQMGKGHQN